MQSKASNTITLHLIENGSTITTRFAVTANGKPASLFQIITPDSGAVSPDWNANPVTITPVAYRQQTELRLIPGSHKWTYNFNEIQFNADGMSADGTFRLDAATGALTILRNLASAQNTANDVISYTGKARLSDTQNIDITHQADIEITEAAQGVYLGVVTPAEAFLSLEERFATLDAELYLGAIPVPAYAVRWKVGNTYINSTPTGSVTMPAYESVRQLATIQGKKINVSRAKIQGTALLIAEFYIQGNLVERASAIVTDLTDDIVIVLTTDNGTAISQEQTTSVRGMLVRGNEPFTPDTAVTWDMRALTSDTLDIAKRADNTEIKTATDTLLVTGADLAANNSTLVVTAEASW